MSFDHVNFDPLPELTENTTSSGRTYITPEGNRYPSITTVLKLLSREGIKEWRDRIGHEKADKIMLQASRRGTEVHEIAERYLNNDPKWKKGVMPINLHTFMQMKPILDKNVNKIWAQEVPLYSDRFKIAGRVDLIAEYQGQLSIIDFKTSRKVKEESWLKGYYLQTAFYAAAFYERTRIPIKQGVIIIATDHEKTQVHKTSTFKHLEELSNIRKDYLTEFAI